MKSSGKLVLALLIGMSILISCFQFLWSSGEASLHDASREENIVHIEIYSINRAETVMSNGAVHSINSHGKQNHHHHHHHHREPMVVSLSYWEQTGNALSNLFDLQCWANSVGIGRVLEPSIKQFGQSTFHFVNGNTNYLKFSDLFDVDHWNSMSLNQNYSQLSSMDRFLECASKDIVFVQMKYAQLQSSCRKVQAVTNDEWYKFLSQKDFRLIDTVCIDFNRAPSQVMEWNTFRDLISKFRNVTFLIDEWRGIRSTDKSVSRVDFTDSRCRTRFPDLSNGHFVPSKPAKTIYLPAPQSISPIVPSKLVLGYLEKFMKKYSLDGAGYVAVMVRTQKIKNLDAKDNNLMARAILSDWKSLKESHNLTRTLFFTDTGRHGSLEWVNPSAKEFSEYVESKLQIPLTYDQMNTALEEITDSTDSVQIAFLQRLLVSRATCAILAGGGTFQIQTVNMYLHFHKGKECYSIRKGPQFAPAFMESVNGYKAQQVT